MKTLLILSLLFFLYCCNSEPKVEIAALPIGKKWNITLENQLGNINIILPNHFDTLISWTQTSDCGDGCSHVDYRVQPRTLPLFKESGFIYFPLKDSVEQFTIKHSKVNYKWQIPDTILKKYLSGRLKYEANKYPSGKYLIDTTLTIDQRFFPAIGYITYDSTDKTTTQYLSACTALKENLLEFFFEYRKNNQDLSSDNFIRNSFKYLKTIRIINSR
jgi:hypothetical protein